MPIQKFKEGNTEWHAAVHYYAIYAPAQDVKTAADVHTLFIKEKETAILVKGQFVYNASYCLMEKKTIATSMPKVICQK